MDSTSVRLTNISTMSATNETGPSSPRVPVINYAAFCQYTSGSYGERFALEIMSCYINPALAFIGFSTNMLSIAILRRSGLKKPSNILLLSLVVADSMNQLQSMNYGEILMLWGPDIKHTELCGWQYSEGVNYFLFISIVIIYFFGGLGSWVNTVIPVIITAERFLAVFLPITFKKIVTRKTAIAAAILAYVVWLPWVLTFASLYQFYRIRITGDDYYSFVALGSKYFRNRALYDLLNHYVFQALATWVPVTLVAVGCTFIGVKVLFVIRLRKKITSAKTKIQWSPRTTRTLLTTCFIFTVTNLTLAFLNFYFLANYKLDIMFMIITEISYFVSIISTSSNFFVYITSNRKLMQIFIDIIHRR